MSKTEIVFEFISEEKISNELKQIKIKDFQIKINLDKRKLYYLEFIENSDCLYKIYPCKFIFENSFKNFSICIYLKKKNHFYCQGYGIFNNSIEIIFIDFNFFKNNLSLCKICYNSKNYEVKEIFEGIKSRKRISFINIDINLISSFNEEINKSTATDYKIILNYVNNNFNIIGVYPNLLNDKFDFLANKNILLNKLNDFYKKTSKFLKFDVSQSQSETNYLNNFNSYKKDEIESFQKFVNDFKIINLEEYKIYFISFINKLDENDIIIYDLLSEYLLTSICIEFSFNLYITQYYYSKLCINNFLKTIPNEINAQEKIKLKLSVSFALYDLIYKEIGRLDDNLFSFVNFSIKDTIYYDAKENCIEFINLLNEESEIFPFFLQINSSQSNNLNDKEIYNYSAKISMISLNEIKDHLYNSLPQYGIRLNIDSDYYAVTIIETRITIYNEFKLFRKYLDKNINIEKDKFYLRRFRLSNLLKHENFCHVKIKMNNYEKKKNILGSPYKYYNFEKNEMELLGVNSKNKFFGESGYAFEYFITKGNFKLIQVLKNPKGDFTLLYKNMPKLLADKSLNSFNQELDKKLNGKNLLGEYYYTNLKYSMTDEKESILEYYKIMSNEYNNNEKLGFTAKV